jgi:hypothetical protein
MNMSHISYNSCKYSANPTSTSVHLRRCHSVHWRLHCEAEACIPSSDQRCQSWSFRSRSARLTRRCYSGSHRSRRCGSASFLKLPLRLVCLEPFGSGGSHRRDGNLGAMPPGVETVLPEVVQQPTGMRGRRVFRSGRGRGRAQGCG